VANSDLHPACFPDREHFVAWVKYAGQTRQPSLTYCTDCTPDYKKRMMEKGKCSHPGVVFVLEEDGLRGVRASMEELMQ
jgi:hypothetical protein